MSTNQTYIKQFLTFLKRKQFRTVFLFQIVLLSVFFLIGYNFWKLLCHGVWPSCIAPTGYIAPLTFIGFAAIRPFVFTPMMIVAAIAGNSFGPLWGTLLTAFGATLSCLLIYLPGKVIGANWIRPWLSANLPSMWHLIRTQDYKIAFISRWIPIFPFDLLSLLFGIANFNARRTLIATFLGCIPEAYVFSRIASTADTEIVSTTIVNLILFGLVTTVPLVVYEYFFRKKGSSLWTLLKRTYYEVVYEIKSNNDIPKRRVFSNRKTPVILLYGFFSSRRSVAIMDRHLTQRGYDVMSFNLGGFFGVFFTRGIMETAAFVKEKIDRQVTRHNFQKIHIVAHSKGGLVALWWALKLGGHKYCDKIITMGTPFKGSLFTYFGLVTPIGFIWKDLWQMRPGSMFLQELQGAKIPEDLNIYCCHSKKDRVARGRYGVFKFNNPSPQVKPIAMHHISHFEFLYKKDVVELVDQILQDKFEPSKHALEAKTKARG
ncbi:MAG: alpha/beta fold hydrolase [Oligoflexales bacterium]